MLLSVRRKIHAGAKNPNKLFRTTKLLAAERSIGLDMEAAQIAILAWAAKMELGTVPRGVDPLLANKTCSTEWSESRKLFD